jgi:hypothetical protein
MIENAPIYREVFAAVKHGPACANERKVSTLQESDELIFVVSQGLLVLYREFERYAESEGNAKREGGGQ